MNIFHIYIHISFFPLRLLNFDFYVLTVLNLVFLIVLSFLQGDTATAFCTGDNSTLTDCPSYPPQPSTSVSRATIMDGMNRHYQMDPYTKQLIINKDGTLADPVCKTNFGFMADALRDMALSSSFPQSLSAPI